MNSEGQKGVKNVFLWAVNTIMLYLGPNEVTGLKKSKQFLLVVRSLCASVCGSCCHGQRRPFFKAQFHFKTQKQRFSDDLKVKSVVVIANFCDDHLFVCVCAVIKLEKNI